MSITNTVNEDLKTAMKAKDQVRMQTLRSLKSALMIDASQDTLQEAEEVAILQKAAKQRRDSAEMYQNANRSELAENELAELAIIESYLPQQMTREEVATIVASAVEESGASSPKDMGLVMKILMPKLKGKADGRLIQELVKEKLQG